MPGCFLPGAVLGVAEHGWWTLGVLADRNTSRGNPTSPAASYSNSVCDTVGLVPHGGAVPEPADQYVHIRGVHGLSAALVPRLAEQATTEWPARILLLVRAAPRSSDDLARTAPRPW